MTREARDDRDKPFCAWLRSYPDLDACKYWLYAADVDMTMFKFKTWLDSSGTREVKLIMDVEIKTFEGAPDDNQLELICIRDQIQRSKAFRWSTKMGKRIFVWSFGQFILFIRHGDRPDKCSALWWCGFAKDGRRLKRQITESQLVSILRFDTDPRTLRPLTLRRHHKTRQITREVDRGLFVVDEIVVIRS